MPTSSSGGSPQRPAGFYPSVKLRVFHQGGIHFSGEIAPAYSIYLDILAGPFHNHGLGEHLKASLGSCVPCYSRSSYFTNQGTDVDDLPLPAGNHSPYDLLRGEKNSSQVNGKHLAPHGFFHVHDRSAMLDTGIVYQYGNRTDLFLDLLYLRIYLVFFCNIECIPEGCNTLCL